MEWMVLGGLHVADRLNGDRYTYPTCPNALRSSWRLGVRQGWLVCSAVFFASWRLGVRQGGWYVPRSLD
jgi:hypothetical protein